MGDERRDRIDRLNDTLYSRTRYKDPQDMRTPVKRPESADVGEKWQTPELDEILKHERIPSVAHPLMKKVFISSLLF